MSIATDVHLQKNYVLLSRVYIFKYHYKYRYKNINTTIFKICVPIFKI